MGLVTPVPSEQVDERLAEVHRRHAEPGGDEVESVYVGGRGMVDPSEARDQVERFGICLVRVDGDVHGVGDFELPFPLHSISKVFTYGLALEDHGRDRVLERVGVKPSGDAFNALEFDQRNNRPHNPMVNAGALATTDLIKGDTVDEREQRVVDVQRRYSANDQLTVDGETLEAERGSADRNRATAYLMRSEGMLDGDVEQTLQRERVRDVLSVMYTCGMYDFAGEWAYEIGIPAKSGVSGGILAVVPGKGGIGVYSPELDRYGNSVRGTRVCAEIANQLGLHLFASEDEDSLLRQTAEG